MSAKILHGRRKGVDRTGQNAVLPDIAGVNGTAVGSGPVDLRQVTIISNMDWDRIQNQLHKRQIEEERLRRSREEKEKLHELSKNQTKNWANTIAGQRQKKLEARKLREAKEEEERKLIDLEEAKFQAQKRKEAIEKAKTQQYYQTDRVKGFHGALLLTEVLKEREAQIELNKLKKEAASGSERAWLEKTRRDYEDSIQLEQEQCLKRMHKQKLNANFQKAQIREHLNHYEKEQQEGVVEGEELKRLAAQYEAERSRLDEIRREEATVLMKDNRRQIEDVKRLRQVQNQQEEEEDEECRIFAAAKRKMMKLRAEKERALHIEKQERLEKIREKLHAQMQQKMDDEDERILRAQKETEEKRVKEEAEKELWNTKMQKEMGDHRHQQMRERERVLAEEKEKEFEMLVVSKAADEQFAQNEEAKRRLRLQNIKNLQNFHGKQMTEKKTVVEKQQQEMLAEDEENMKLLALEERQFQEYAQRVIEHCEKGDRNVYPLRKAAQPGVGGGRGPLFIGKGGIRPSFMVADQSGVQMPNYQRGTTDETKRTIYGNGQTNKRLGFVW